MAKTRAIPSLHRDNFLAKVPGFCPVLSSGNTTSPYCRAVSNNGRRVKSVAVFTQQKKVYLQLDDGYSEKQ